MNYCRHCMVPTEEDACPLCGEKKLLAHSAGGTPALCGAGGALVGNFSRYIAAEGHPLYGKPQWGAGWTATLGSKFELLHFYVPYEYLPAAQRVGGELFSQSGEESEEE